MISSHFDSERDGQDAWDGNDTDTRNEQSASSDPLVDVSREEPSSLESAPQHESHEQLEPQQASTQRDTPQSTEQANAQQNSSSEHPEPSSFFECNICFDQAQEPVITQCGHLYCWSCLYRWMHSPNTPTLSCPVCKGGVSKEKLIPIYGRGGPSADLNTNPNTGEHTDDPIPDRPAGTRAEPQANPNFTNGNYFNAFGGQNGIFGGGFMFGSDMSFFSLPFFGVSMNFGSTRPRGTNHRNRSEVDDDTEYQRQFLKRLLLFFALIVFLCIVSM